MADIQFTIRTTTVPVNLQHKSRSQEIEELPQYLQVNMSSAHGLALINMGPNTPAPENSQFPWLKTTVAGVPLGWYVMVNGLWTTNGGLTSEYDPNNPIIVAPTGVITTSIAAPQLPVLTLSGGVPPYAFVSGDTAIVTFAQAGVNNQLIYPIGNSEASGTLRFTDSVRSSILSIYFTVTA